MYENGDEVMFIITGEYGRVIDDYKKSKGLYEVRLDNGEEYTFKESEIA